MSKTAHDVEAVITEWSIGARGHGTAIGGSASFVLSNLDVSEILKAAEVAVLQALKVENISGDISEIELRIEFERRDGKTSTRTSGYARLDLMKQNMRPV